MILWTMQPIEVWNIVQETGVFRCDPALCSMPEPVFAEKYEWLIRHMEERIGPRPEGVTYPIWAWHTQNRKHEKPDLRRERWDYGTGNEQYVCIEIEVPDNQVLLSDFDDWCIILNNGLLTASQEEYDRLDAYCDGLKPADQIAFKHANWVRVFDVSPVANSWEQRGEWVQANFWELQKDMIRSVRFFKTGKRKW